MAQKDSFERGSKVIRETLARMPMAPGVYRMRDAKGQVLYVGKAKHLSRRVISYTQEARLSLRLRRMVVQVASLDWIETETEVQALLLEADQIKTLRPRYNILFRDSKAFSSLYLSNHKAPGLFKQRGRRTEAGTYFGPFPSMRVIETTLRWLQKAFLLRSCSDTVFSSRSRPCLLYHLKRCAAPCVNTIAPEAYRELVDQAQKFLEGRGGALRRRLTREMQDARTVLEFERAAEIRDRLYALEQLSESPYLQAPDLGDTDIVVLACEGETACILVVFLRGGLNYGDTHFFCALEAGPEDALAGFCHQFYQKNVPPPLILVNHTWEDIKASEDVLNLLRIQGLQERKKEDSGSVKVICPQRGDKATLVRQAQDQALKKLKQREDEVASTHANLLALQTWTGMAYRPRRIEVYDNSHLQGDHPVAAMIVADETGFIHRAYRRFSLQFSKNYDEKQDLTRQDGHRLADDYALMTLAMQRRFGTQGNNQKMDNQKVSVGEKGQAQADLPDMILLDGGKGQITAALRGLDPLFSALTRPFILAIAKGPNRNAGEETFYVLRPGERVPEALQLDTGSLRFYLQRLRDEAHRFVIGTHRIKRLKTLESSGLDNVPGLGPQRKKILLRRFGSMQGVRGASRRTLLKTPGLPVALLEKICDHFDLT